MIAKLEFTLPEEATEHLVAVHAADLLGAMEEFLNWLRTQRKHGPLSDEQRVFADMVWERWWIVINAHGVEDLV